MIISSGEVHTYMTYSGKDFVIDKLTQGSVIGTYRIIGDEHPFSLGAKAGTAATLQVLSKARFEGKMNKFIDRNENIEQIIG